MDREAAALRGKRLMGSKKNESTDAMKCRVYADKLLAGLKAEVKSKGYREDMGSKERRELEDYISKFDVSYQEKVSTLNYFESGRDSL